MAAFLLIGARDRDVIFPSVKRLVILLIRTT